MTKIANTEEKKASYPLNDLMNLNKSFKKSVTYDTVKTLKKAVLHRLSENTAF